MVVLVVVVQKVKKKKGEVLWGSKKRMGSETNMALICSSKHPCKHTTGNK